MGFRRNFRRSWSTAKIYRMKRPFFLLTLFTSGFFVSNTLRKVVDLTTLNILRTTRAMLMNYCINELLERLTVIPLKYRKPQLLSISCCQDVPEINCTVKSNPLPNPNPLPAPPLLII